MTTPLSDPDNVELVVVEEEPTGMTVEDAYRHLVGLAPNPVPVVPEE